MNRWSIGLGMAFLLLLYACQINEDKTNANVKESTNDISKTPFNLFEIDFGCEVKVSRHTVEGNYSSWIVKLNTGEILIEILENKSDSTMLNSISNYDNILSLSNSEKEKYSIQNLSINGLKYRLIQRIYQRDKNFVELFGKNVCSNNSQILITATDLTDHDLNWLKESFKTIKLRCN